MLFSIILSFSVSLCICLYVSLLVLLPPCSMHPALAPRVVSTLIFGRQPCKWASNCACQWVRRAIEMIHVSLHGDRLHVLHADSQNIPSVVTELWQWSVKGWGKYSQDFYSSFWEISREAIYNPEGTNPTDFCTQLTCLTSLTARRHTAIFVLWTHPIKSVESKYCINLNYVIKNESHIKEIITAICFIC